VFLRRPVSRISCIASAVFTIVAAWLWPVGQEFKIYLQVSGALKQQVHTQIAKELSTLGDISFVTQRAKADFVVSIATRQHEGIYVLSWLPLLVSRRESSWDQGVVEEYLGGDQLVGGPLSGLEQTFEKLVRHFDREFLQVCRDLRIELNGVIENPKAAWEEALRRRRAKKVPNEPPR